MIILCLLLLLLIYMIYYSYTRISCAYVEPYDARYTNMTVDGCSKFCKKTSGCFGFAFNAQNKTCYPADNPIMGPPIGTLFEDEYKDSNLVCNKMDAIIVPTKAPSFDKRKSNALFVCGEKPSLQPQLYLHNNDRLNLIEEGQNPDFITKIDEYNVDYYKWPINKYDSDQLDKLWSDRENQKFTKNTVTLMDRVRNANPPVNTNLSINTQPTKKSSGGLKDLGNKFISNIINLQKVIQIPIKRELNIKYDPEHYKNIDHYKNVDRLKNTNQFEVHKPYNHGVFLFNHKCARNIPKRNCLEYCLNNKNCIGVEYNPRFFRQENVCCPYKSIGDFVERKDMHRSGSFYRKITDNKVINDNNIYLNYK